MMVDINAGKVNCVLVKDLSRLGRDYIETGRLMQATFPTLGVRFIAVVEQYDSLTANETDSSLMLPIKNFVNDSYCRDISMKVKAQQKIKRLEGKCISAFTVYGYLKNPDDKNQLIIDDYAADIVKRVFMWKIAGMSLGAIANKLNKLYILSPMEYKKFLGMKFHTGFESASTGKWAAISVKRILVNQVYIGNMVQGKQEKISYKVNKRINKPEQEWICVKNTHDGIISQTDFDIVQDLLKYDSRACTKTQDVNLFSGVLLCAECNAPMIKRINTYKGMKNVFYICQTKNKSLGCSRHSIREDVLRKIVLKEIKESTSLLMGYSEVLQLLQEMNVDCEQVIEYDTQINALQREYNKYYGLKRVLLTDLKEGLIDREEFEEFCGLYEEKCSELELAVNSQKYIIKQMFQSGVTSKFQIEKLKKSFDLTELTRELMLKVIKNIYIHEDKRIEIVFRYGDEMSKLDVVKQFYDEKVASQEVL